MTILIPSCQKEKNRPPSLGWINLPYGPNSGLVGWTYLYWITVYDSDWDSVAARFDWGDGDTSDWSPWQGEEDTLELGSEIKIGGTCETIYMFHSWQYPGTYYIKAQAKDKKEAFSEWSKSNPIIISDTLANQPFSVSSIHFCSSKVCVDTVNQFLSLVCEHEVYYITNRFNFSCKGISELTSWALSDDSACLLQTWSYPETYYLKRKAKNVGILTLEWLKENEIIISSNSILKGREAPLE